MLHSSKDPSLLGLPTPLPIGVLPRNRLDSASWAYSSGPLCSSASWTPRRMQDAFISDQGTIFITVLRTSPPTGFSSVALFLGHNTTMGGLVLFCLLVLGIDRVEGSFGGNSTRKHFFSVSASWQCCCMGRLCGFSAFYPNLHTCTTYSQT